MCLIDCLSFFHRDKINACQNLKLNNAISGGVLHSRITVFCRLSFQVFPLLSSFRDSARIRQYTLLSSVLMFIAGNHSENAWNPSAGICPQTEGNCPGWFQSPDSYWVMVWNEARLILIPAYVQMFPPLFVVGLNGLRQIWNKLRMPCSWKILWAYEYSGDASRWKRLFPPSCSLKQIQISIAYFTELRRFLHINQIEWFLWDEYSKPTFAHCICKQNIIAPESSKVRQSVEKQANKMPNDSAQ